MKTRRCSCRVTATDWKKRDGLRDKIRLQSSDTILQHYKNEILEASMKLHEKNLLLQTRYNLTASFYDILDYPWERIYKKWRPTLVGDLRGKILEAGVGTGRNLEFYHQDAEVVGIELSKQMLSKAEKRKFKALCKVELMIEDATVMQSLDSNTFDWIFSTFMCCVMPEEIQHLAIEQFGRVLKQGARFRLLEIVYSKNRKIRKRQDFFAPYVEMVYGARFDRNTLQHIEQSSALKVTNTSFLKNDTYLLIEGIRV